MTCKARLRDIAVSALAAVCVVGAMATGATSVAAPTQAAIGVYTGAINVAGDKAFATTTGANVTIALGYLTTNDGWAGISTPAGPSWYLNAWKNSGYRLAIGVPLVPTDAANQPVTTLAQGATGANNSYFTSLAQILVGAGEGSAIIRLGWEFDGNWYAWSAANGSSAADYAAYWRQVVTAMRAVPGADFTFVWNPDLSAFQSPSSRITTTEAAYPGNAYVDQIGVDFYDVAGGNSCGLVTTGSSTPSNTTTPAQTLCLWNSQNLPDLNTMASFATANGKPMAFPEWGLSHFGAQGGALGDDPTFVDMFSQWVSSHDVAWTAYFDATQAGTTKDFAITDGNFPNALAAYKSDFATGSTATPPTTQPPPPVVTAPRTGYRLATSAGQTLCFQVVCYGSLTGALNRPIVGMARTPNNAGYWMVASDGGVFSFGDAGFYGSTGAMKLNRPIVGMATTPDGKGYWLVASDGGIFSFGDAQFHGSTGAMILNRPVVGMAASPDGKGYWLVATDGGIFAFGYAGFHGATGNITLNKPISGMASTTSGGGYWMVASDGGIFAFGDAGFHGSAAGSRPATPVMGMSATSDGAGYWIAAAGGQVFAFGDAPNHGDTNNANSPVSSIS